MKNYTQIFEAYKLGAKYSSDFDYEGMLKAGLKVKVTDKVANLQKLFNSFQDVNYHTAAAPLSMAIDELKDKNKKDAEYFLNIFRDNMQDELDSNF